jgi:predicted nucleic acid-binding protein
MAVVVFDSDVLIGFLSASDAHHGAAVKLVGESMIPGTRRLLSAVNYSEILIGQMRAGEEARDHVNTMLGRFAIEITVADSALAQRAAAVRAETDLKLPDAYAVATAVQAKADGHGDVRLASFDKAVLQAHARLDPA